LEWDRCWHDKTNKWGRCVVRNNKINPLLTGAIAQSALDTSATMSVNLGGKTQQINIATTPIRYSPRAKHKSPGRRVGCPDRWPDYILLMIC
jgi:hypothetical protein